MTAPAASTRLQVEQEQLQQIEGHLQELEAELKEKLLADADDEAVARLDLEIARFKRKAEHHRLRIDSLNAAAAIEAKAAARKQTAELIERIEAACDERVKNSQAITRTVAKLIELIANDISLSKKVMAAWPWGTRVGTNRQRYSRGCGRGCWRVAGLLRLFRCNWPLSRAHEAKAISAIAHPIPRPILQAGPSLGRPH
jgi:hypothetical protein